MNSLHRLLLSVSILSLSACGGGSSSGGPDVVTPTVEQAVTLSLGTFPVGVDIIDNGNDTWTFSFPVTGDRVTTSVQVGNSSVARYRDGGTSPVGSVNSFYNTILQGSTSSNSGVATYFLGLPLDSPPSGFSIVELERSGPTTIPTSGTVVMTGKTALNFIDRDGFVVFSAEGNAELTADFGGTISGSTSDLTIFGEAANPPFDPAVTFVATPISSGGFVGTSTLNANPTIRGSYQGIFVGPAAGEAIGGYSFTDGAGERIEGIFIVE